MTRIPTKFTWGIPRYTTDLVKGDKWLETVGGGDKIIWEWTGKVWKHIWDSVKIQGKENDDYGSGKI